MRRCMTEIGFIQALPMGALGDNRTSMLVRLELAVNKMVAHGHRT